MTSPHWIPAFAGLLRQDAEANIRIADGPKGERMTSHVMTNERVRVAPADTGQ